MNKNVHFSSQSDDWETPDEFFHELNKVFHFGLDVCASATNAKCERYFTREDDALTQEWKGTVWMNPPYGRQIGDFMKKAYEESLKGATVVCLVPSRTDTEWWHRYAKHGLCIFIRRRLKFGGSANAAPFPSAIVIFFGGRLGEATKPIEDLFWPDTGSRKAHA
ncbi:MAG: adenine methyltransferase [Phycisphaerae bacterium]|nr:adenine methyltransferase [Phycisphaerae bacterium]